LSERPDDESVLRDWLSLLSRQKWIVLLAVTVVPLLAFAASHSQQRLYRASATVLVSEQNPTAEALKLTSSVASPPDRYAATQAKLARVGTVARMAVKAAHVPHRTATALLANSSVSADPTVDLLTFSVTDPAPAVAMTLANVYAREFTVYRRALDTGALSAAIADAGRKLNAIVASGGGGSPLASRLEATQRDLEELQTLEATGSSATLVGRAARATLVQPKTTRNVILAVIVGLALGIALAFLREALDTRVRSVDELRARLGVPLLGHIPRPGRRLAPKKHLPTLSDPTGASTEAFRILKNNLEISQLEHHAGSIAITSTSEDEDGSATAANLAVILARSGRHVILVDLNLRHPRIAQLFGLRDRPGLTSVALGVTLVDALRVVDVSQPGPPRADSGTLEVVTAGQQPPDPGEFLLSSLVAETLEVLEERCDVLLIVTPPLLAAGDAMTIAPHADALILIAGIDRARREALVEARRVLERCPTFTLGVIATGGKATEGGNGHKRVRSALTLRRNGYAGRQRLLATSSGPHLARASRKLFAAVSAPIRARRGRGDGSGPSAKPQERPQQVPDG
jgi:polysaccharide biosynthesis transport protein